MGFPAVGQERSGDPVYSHLFRAPPCPCCSWLCHSSVSRLCCATSSSCRIVWGGAEVPQLDRPPKPHRPSNPTAGQAFKTPQTFKTPQALAPVGLGHGNSLVTQGCWDWRAPDRCSLALQWAKLVLPYPKTASLLDPNNIQCNISWCLTHAGMWRFGGTHAKSWFISLKYERTLGSFLMGIPLLLLGCLNSPQLG